VGVKAVVIAGSPRHDGNSDILAGRLAAGLRAGGADVELISAREMRVGGCLACYHCARTGQCIQKDDMQHLYELLLDSHRVCLVTPIFFCQVPSICQAIIERGQALWARKYMRGERPPFLQYPRQGLAVAVGGTRGNKVFDGLRCAAHYWFDTMDISQYHVLTYGNVDEKGAILGRPEALEEVYQAGRALSMPEPSSD